MTSGDLSHEHDQMRGAASIADLVSQAGAQVFTLVREAGRLWCSGAGAGLISGVIFKQVWKFVGHDDDAPYAADEDGG